MKHFSRFLGFLLLSAAVVAVSCKKMDDIYKDFVKDGETVYIGKADSAFVRGGYHRAEVVWLLKSDPKVSGYTLFWNNGRDSVSGAVTKTENVDTVRVLLDNMTEGTHHFTIRMYDRHGNTSVPTYVSGSVYGPQYEQTLLDRTYRGMVRVGRTDLEVIWTPAEESAVGIEARYTNRAGEEQTYFIPGLLNTSIFSSFPVNGEFRYRTLFMPDELALDTFATDFATVRVNDEALGGRQLSFTTEGRSGTPPNQLSIWVSTDFDGVYEVENVEAATWVEITDRYPLASVTNTVTPWGPIDLWDMMGDDDSQIYVAFKYTFNPDNPLENGGINWRIQNFAVRTNAGAQLLNQEQAQFTLVHKGPLEDGRISVSPTLMLLRRNAADTQTPTTTWGITRAIE